MVSQKSWVFRRLRLKRAVADADCVVKAPEEPLTSAERSLIIWGFDLLGS